MNSLQHTKFVGVVDPQAIVDNASWASKVIDTAGWAYLQIIAQIGALDIAMTALKIQEADAASDATTLTSPVDVAGCVTGTSAGDSGAASVLPSATADNTLRLFEIDLRGRKRFIKLIATGGDGAAGTFLSALGILSRSPRMPLTAADRGVAEILRPTA